MSTNSSTIRSFLRSVLPFVIGFPILYVLHLSFQSAETWAVLLASVGVNVILAVSLNVVNGFTGQFSLGHAGFMAVGAYTAAKITTGFAGMQIAFLPEVVSDQIIFALALCASMAAAAVAGFLVGMPSLRLRGDYLAIVTLGFGEIIRSIIENISFLGQASGIHGLPPRSNLIWVGISVIATIVMARRLSVSTEGRALFAIREDEIAAEAMGVNTTGYKVRAFVISAAYAGLAGALLAHSILIITPKMFNFVKSIEIVVMIVLGGLGSISGSILAAIVLTIGPDLLREFDRYRMVVYAVVLIVLMLTRPQGLFGTREIWEFPLFRKIFGSKLPKPSYAGASPTEVDGSDEGVE